MLTFVGFMFAVFSGYSVRAGRPVVGIVLGTISIFLLV
jgi:hypothetical protein